MLRTFLCTQEQVSAHDFICVKISEAYIPPALDGCDWDRRPHIFMGFFVTSEMFLKASQRILFQTRRLKPGISKTVFPPNSVILVSEWSPRFSQMTSFSLLLFSCLRFLITIDPALASAASSKENKNYLHLYGYLLTFEFIIYCPISSKFL